MPSVTISPTVSPTLTAPELGSSGRSATVHGCVSCLRSLSFQVDAIDALDDGERERHPERDVHADRQRAEEAGKDRLADPGAAVDLDDRLHDADDRHDDAEEQEEDVPIGEEELRTDEVHRPPGHPGRQAARVAELLEDGGLGGDAVLAVGDAVLDGIGDRGTQLAIDVRALLRRDPAQRRREVALGERGHSMSPPFRACSDAVRSVMSVMSWAASAEPAGLVR